MNSFVALLALASLCGVAVSAKPKDQSLTLKGCDHDAIIIAGEYLQNGQSSVKSMKCFEEWAGCVEKSYNLTIAIQACAKELNRPELLDKEKLIAVARDTSPANYLSTLHAMCCVKQKEGTLNNKSMQQVRAVIRTFKNYEPIANYPGKLA